MEAPGPTSPTVRGEGREKILKAAREIFSHKGFARASIREIASRAGVTEPPVYWHFKNKRGLFEAAVSEPIVDFITGFFADWRAREPGENPPVEEAMQYFDGLFDVLHSERELLLAMLADQEFGGEEDGRNRGLSDVFALLLDQHERLLTAEIARRGYRQVDTYLWARIFFSTILGWTLHGSLIDPSGSRTRQQMVRELAEMSIYGTINAPPTRPELNDTGRVGASEQEVVTSEPFRDKPDGITE